MRPGIRRVPGDAFGRPGSHPFVGRPAAFAEQPSTVLNVVEGDRAEAGQGGIGPPGGTMRLRIGDVGLGQREPALQLVRDASEQPSGKHDVVQAKFVVGLCFESANLQLIESLDPEPVDYRLELEAGRFHDRVVHGVPGPGREAKFGAKPRRPRSLDFPAFRTAPARCLC